VDHGVHQVGVQAQPGGADLEHQVRAPLLVHPPHGQFGRAVSHPRERHFGQLHHAIQAQTADHASAIVQ